jgi:hypothetical protein
MENVRYIPRRNSIGSNWRGSVNATARSPFAAVLEHRPLPNASSWLKNCGAAPTRKDDLDHHTTVRVARI